MLCGKGTRHIDIRYLYVTDMVAKDQIRIVHCRTLEMIADFFTKPLQGKQFRKFRNMILGIHPEEWAAYFIQYMNALKEFGLDK